MKTAKEFVHKGNFGQPNLDTSRCAFSVHERGARSFNMYQCQKGVAETIDGVGFCKVHAKEVKRRLGVSDVVGIIFAAGFSQGSPNLAKLEITDQTEHTLEIKTIKRAMGSCYPLWEGPVRKDSHAMRDYEFFDDIKDAIRYLIGKSENNIRFCEKQLEEAVSIHDKLVDTLR